jgi:hypothetical protein
MIFDDHEVTDDWNVFGSWQTDVYDTELGRRVVGNALSAYAVFQAWGNEPAGEFAPTGKGGALLLSLSKYQAGDGSDYNEESATYLSIREAMRIPPGQSPTAVRWDYRINYAGHKVIVLDTRTHREFPDLNSPSQGSLLGPTEIDRQVTQSLNPERQVTVLVSPAPVIGHPFHEQIVQRKRDVKFLGERTRKSLEKASARFTDRESWWVNSRPAAFESLLERLVPFQRVVILSGDVHYGFTVGVRYWNERNIPGKTAAYVQLVSSALKNEDFKTHAISGITRIAEPMTKLPDSVGYLGWAMPGFHLKDGSTLIHVPGEPAVQQVPRGTDTIDDDEPQWRYRLGFCTDSRTSKNRDVASSPPPFSASAANYLERKRALAWEQRWNMMNDQQRTSVGVNNLCEVGFSVTPPYYEVIQSFWYRLESTAPALPYTIHFASLTLPDANESPPTPQFAANTLRDLSAWADLISFIPSHTVQRSLTSRGPAAFWHFHRIEHGNGPINLDYYGVRITKMPEFNNATDDAETLLRRVRRALFVADQIVDSTASVFSGYDGIEAAKWNDADPSIVETTLVTIKIPFDEGSVLATRCTEGKWIFSTVFTPKDGTHPVSGNRLFGFVKNEDGSYSFFTKGADRPTLPGGPAFYAAIFSGADTLWKSFQNKVAAFVTSHGGIATIEPPISERYDWREVQFRYCSPSGSWLKS